MGFVPTLPAELWLVIFELAIEARISLVEQCDPISFPDIDAHVRSPKDHPLADDIYRQLRLVCRNFHAILGTSPHFLMKSTESIIPVATRALYIIGNPNYSLKHLPAEPSRSHRIIKIDITGDFWVRQYPQIGVLETLWEISGSLPNLRNLVIRLRFCPSEYVKRLFWIRLNDAFPLLACLILSLDLQFRADYVHPSDAITLQHLQILDLSRKIHLHSGIHLPSLRHIALGNFSRYDGVALARSPLLESVLLRDVDHGTRIDLRSFPRLRLIGVPMWMERIIDPIDAVHHLEHLWIYMRPPSPSKYFAEAITQIPRRLPAISRITIDFSLSYRADSVQLKKMLQKKYLRSSGLIMQSNLGDGSRIVLERTWMYGPPKFVAKPGAGEKRGILEGIFRKIRL